MTMWVYGILDKHWSRLSRQASVKTFSIHQAIAQEIQFRGVLLGALERQQSRRVALVTQALIFGVAHIAVQYQGPADSFIPIVILLGLIWGWMTQRSNSILPAAVVHVVAELFLVATIVSGLYGQ
jgi:membrane protease YdiL (CAAX protease family)